MMNPVRYITRSVTRFDRWVVHPKNAGCMESIGCTFLRGFCVDRMYIGSSDSCATHCSADGLHACFVPFAEEKKSPQFLYARQWLPRQPLAVRGYWPREGERRRSTKFATCLLT